MRPTSELFTTIAGLAKLAGVHRAVVVRLVAQKKLMPAAFLEAGQSAQPLFRPADATTVFRESQPPKNQPLQS